MDVGDLNSKILSLTAPSLESNNKLVPSESIKNSGPDNNSVNNNSPPSARDDRIRTEQNKPLVFAVLANDKDLDGDKIKIISVSSPKNGGTVMINENDTITLYARKGFCGCRYVFLCHCR